MTPTPLTTKQRLELYETSEYEQVRFQRVEKLLQTQIQAATRVLEIGAGTGRFTDILLRKSCEVDVVEADAGRVEYLQQKYSHPTDQNHSGALNPTPSPNSKVRIYKGLFPHSVEHFQPQLETYDEIVLLEVLEHVPDPQAFLQALYPLLKKRGKLVISTPNRWSMESVVHLAKFVFKGQVFNAGDSTHLWLFSPTQLKRLLRRTGFHVTYQESYHFGCGDKGGGKIPGLPLYLNRLRAASSWPLRLFGFNLIWCAEK